MASPSARKGLLLGSTNDTRLAPPACSTAPERPKIDVSLPQRGPWSPGRHVPHKVAILPREVSFAARIYQNGLPAPLARGRGAPRTQLGHSVTWAAFSARLDEVSPRCWLVTPSPRQCEAPRAHTTRALSVLRVCGWTLVPRTAHPRVGSTRAPFIWGLCSAVSGCAAHYHTLGAAPEPQHTPYVRAERAWADRTAYILHPRTRGFHTE